MQLLKKLLSKLNTFMFNDQRRWEEDYLSQSVDHVDLERRIKPVSYTHLTLPTSDLV